MPNIFEVFRITPLRVDPTAAAPPPGSQAAPIGLGEESGRALAFDADCLTLRRDVYSFNGYRQSYRYFSGAEAALRKTLQFRNASLTRFATSWLSHVNATAGDPLAHRRGPRQIVGIHVRYGMRNTKFDGCLPPADFYLRSMNYYRTKYKNVLFVYAVESSGLDWVQTQVLGRDPFHGFDVSSPCPLTLPQ